MDFEHENTGPQASRPHMPGYGILDAESGAGLLPWSWAAERLTKARNYWISTTRPDGRPHSMPIWGVWVDEKFYFSTGRNSRKARNLETNPNCVICPERGDEAVVLEGVAAVVTDAALIKQVINAFNVKYRWNMKGSEGPLYVVCPRVAFAFDINGGQFIGSATRWIFKD